MPATTSCLWLLCLPVALLARQGTASAEDDNATLSRNSTWPHTPLFPIDLNDDNDTDSAVVLTRDPSSAVNESLPAVVSPPCPGCAEKRRRQELALNASEVRKMRINVIKEQILARLNMKSRPPHHANRSSLPEIIFKSGVLGAPAGKERKRHQGADDDYETAKKVVLFPSNSESNYSCAEGYKNASRCYDFKVTPRKFPGGVTDAELFIFKKGDFQPNESIVITEVVTTGLNKTKKERILVLGDQPMKAGWLKFNLTRTLQRWITKPHFQYSLQVKCKGCQLVDGDSFSDDDKHKTFLFVSTGPIITVSRKRRETVCTETSTRCCKESLSLTFEEIGWGDWIIHPANFTANYCRGTCMSEIENSRYYHTTVMLKYFHSQRAKNIEPSFSLCCTPSRMSSMSIIYMGPDNEVQQSVFTNMVVEACDCA